MALRDWPRRVFPSYGVESCMRSVVPNCRIEQTCILCIRHRKTENSRWRRRDMFAHLHRPSNRAGPSRPRFVPHQERPLEYSGTGVSREFFIFVFVASTVARVPACPPISSRTVSLAMGRRGENVPVQEMVVLSAGVHEAAILGPI